MPHVRAATLLVLLLLSGCPKPAAEPPTPTDATDADTTAAAADATASDGAEAATEGGGFTNAPHPFTPEQIRNATNEGRTYTFVVEAEGQPKSWREMRFTDVTDEGCTISHRQWAEGGEPESFPGHTQTWQDLWSHATYPAELTTIVDEEVTVPAGTFACRRYDVLSSGKKLLSTRAWFATELPGAPVKMEAYDAGTLQITTVLEKHENPAP